MTERVEAQGIRSKNKSCEWDDGSDHDDVTQIFMISGREGIQTIKIDYVKTEQPIDGPFHGHQNTGFMQKFEIDHLKNEHLESVEAYFSYGTSLFQGLQFKTNLRVSEIMGTDNGSKFTLAIPGKKIIGFHGCTESWLDTLGAYFTWVTPTRMEAEGGNGGTDWDDGANHDGVTKIHVRTGYEGIQYIKFDYVDKDGHPKESHMHGSDTGRGFTLEPFEINHLDNEYLLSVDGYYEDASGVIQALQFKTNMKTSDLMGYDEKGTKFTIGCNGNKITGFHGYAGKHLHSLGAYFTTLPLTKLEAKGGIQGVLWDDGTFHGVRKVYVCYNAYVRCIRFEYDNGNKVETRQHGSKVEFVGEEGQFVLDYPNEFLTSVEGTFVKSGNSDGYITSLTFKTSKKRTSPRFGNVFNSENVEFVLESKGCALVGFYGKSEKYFLHSLGAYSFPMPPLDHDAEKQEAQTF